MGSSNQYDYNLIDNIYKNLNVNGKYCHYGNHTIVRTKWTQNWVIIEFVSGKSDIGKLHVRHDKVIWSGHKLLQDKK